MSEEVILGYVALLLRIEHVQHGYRLGFSDVIPASYRCMARGNHPRRINADIEAVAPQSLTSGSCRRYLVNVCASRPHGPGGRIVRMPERKGFVPPW